MDSINVRDVEVDDLIHYKGEVVQVLAIHKDEMSWEIQFLVKNDKGTFYTDYISHKYRIEVDRSAKLLRLQRERKTTYQEDREENKVDYKDVIDKDISVRKNRFSHQDSLRYQREALKSLRGEMKVYSTKDKMHKVKNDDFFAIKKSGNDVYEWHWYQVLEINRKEKILVLKSLQTQKVYNWKYKGGEHFVIPTK